MINKVEIVDKGHGEVSVKIDGEEFAGKINKYSIVHSVDDVLRMTITFPVKQLNITCLTDKMKKYRVYIDIFSGACFIIGHLL